MFLQLLQRAWQPGNQRYRYVLDGPSGRLRDGRRNMNRPVPWKQDAAHARAIAVTDDRPEIARVSDTVDRNEERRNAPIATNQSAEIDLWQFVGVGENTLGSLTPRLVIELGPPDVEQRHPARRRDLCDVRNTRVALEFGTDPYLLNLAPFAHQQLTHGLASLHLAPAETFCTARGAGRSTGVAPTR